MTGKLVALLVTLGCLVAAPSAAALDLSLNKTDSPDPVKQNQQLTYTLTVFNHSVLETATDVTITDELPAGVAFDSAPGCSRSARIVTCNIPLILPQQSAVRQIVVRPTEEGVITNLAEVEAAGQPDTVPGNNNALAQTTVEGLAMPDLAIAKADDPDPVVEGQELTYTLTATNVENTADGVDNATGVVITDTLPASADFVSATGGCSEAGGTVTCNVGRLDEGAEITREIVVRPTEDGTIENTASISGNEPDPVAANNSATEETTVSPSEPDLAITKTDSPDPVRQNSELTYTLTVTNIDDGDANPDNATGVTITDTLPNGVGFVSASAGCSEAGGTVTCNVGALAEGASAVRQIVVRPAEDGTIENTASVAGDQDDPDEANNSDTEQTTVQPAQADLTLVKSDAPDPVKDNADLTYAVRAINNGPDNATGVTVTDTLPTSVDFISASAGCSASDGTVTCVLGSLGDDEFRDLEIVVRPREPGAIRNVASISGDETDPVPGNNSRFVNTEVVAAEPDLAITKTDSPDPVVVGQELTYTITIGNLVNADNGTDNATGVVISDALPASVNFVSASAGCGESGGTVTCPVGALDEGTAAQREIVVRPTEAGTVENTASVASDETDPDPANNSATAQTTVQAPPEPTPPTPTPPTSEDCRGNEIGEASQGGSDDDVMIGTEASDILRGGAGDDSIDGLGAQDCLDGEAGEDTIVGGEGNDIISGGGNIDAIFGELGNDRIGGDGGADVIKGGNGHDRIRGNGGKDTLRGDDGRDNIAGGGGNDKVRGGEGDDVVRGNASNDNVKGNDGDDVVRGGAGLDKLKGNAGDDNIKGGTEADIVNGNAGNDTLRGNNGADKVRGGGGNDDVSGGGGKDNLKGHGGKDVLRAVDGKRDVVNCGGGNNDKAVVDKKDKVLNCETIKVKKPKS